VARVVWTLKNFISISDYDARQLADHSHAVAGLDRVIGHNTAMSKTDWPDKGLSPLVRAEAVHKRAVGLRKYLEGHTFAAYLKALKEAP
jgi:hypothetical protein